MNKKILIFILLLTSLVFAQTRIQDLQAVNTLKNGDLFLITQDNTGLTPGQYNGRKMAFSYLLAQLQDSIITVLDTLTFVRTFGNQTINGIKTFSSDILTTATKGIKSVNYKTGFITGTGYAISKGLTGYTAEFDNLFIRGSLTANEFIRNQTQVNNGDLMIANGAQVKGISNRFQESGYITTIDGKILTTSGGTSLITAGYTRRAEVEFQDADGKTIMPFKKNDLFMIQQYTLDGKNIIKTIKGIFVEVRGAEMNYFVDYTEGTLSVGDFVAQVGNTTDTTRQNLIRLIVNGENAPRIELLSGIDSFSKLIDGTATKIILGKLDGEKWEGIPLSGFGLLAKTGASYLQQGNYSGKVVVGSGDVDSSLLAQKTLIDAKLDSAGVGSLAYQDLVNLALLDSTIIQRGFIKTSLVETDALLVTGYGTFGDYQDSVNTAIQAKLDSSGVGSLAYEDLVNIALVDTTLIIGGYVKTSLINTNALIVSGYGTFGDYQDSVNAAIQTKLDSSGVGSLAYEDLVSLAYLDTTVVIGGYLKNTLINTKQLIIRGSTLESVLGGQSDSIAVGYNKNKTSIGSTPPANPVNGDIWLSTEYTDPPYIDNAQYRYDGSGWDIFLGAGTGIATYIDETGIYTGTLTANQIYAVGITADSIKTGTLSGVTVQSSNGDNRVVLSNGDAIDFYYGGDLQGTISGYFSSPINQIQITTGLVEITGALRTSGDLISLSGIYATDIIESVAGFGISGGGAGISTTKTWSDSDSTHTVTIEGGIITGWTTVANSPSVASKTLNKQNNIFAILPRNIEFNQKNTYNKLTNLRLK